MYHIAQSYRRQLTTTCKRLKTVKSHTSFMGLSTDSLMH